MPFWTEQVVPRFTDKMLATRDVMNHRRTVVDGLRGDVIEIGFGSGLNVPIYPAEVTTVFAVDPSLVGRKLSADRVAASPVRVEFVGLNGEEFDSALEARVVLEAWTEEYNLLRPHRGLGMMTPRQFADAYKKGRA